MTKNTNTQKKTKTVNVKPKDESGGRRGGEGEDVEADVKVGLDDCDDPQRDLAFE